MTSTFQDATSSCADWYASPGFLICGGLFGVSPTIFAIYSNNLLSQALSLESTSLILFL